MECQRALWPAPLVFQVDYNTRKLHGGLFMIGNRTWSLRRSVRLCAGRLRMDLPYSIRVPGRLYCPRNNGVVCIKPEQKCIAEPPNGLACDRIILSDTGSCYLGWTAKSPTVAHYDTFLIWITILDYYSMCLQETDVLHSCALRNMITPGLLRTPAGWSRVYFNASVFTVVSFIVPLIATS